MIQHPDDWSSKPTSNYTFDQRDFSTFNNNCRRLSLTKFQRVKLRSGQFDETYKVNFDGFFLGPKCIIHDVSCI